MEQIKRILAEIHRLKNELEGYSAQEVLDYIESYINIISREQPSSSDLDEAAEKYANKEYPDEASCGQWGTGDYEPPVDMEYPREVAKDSFKAGAEWQYQKDRGEFAKLKAKEWMSGYDDAVSRFVKIPYEPRDWFSSGDGDFICGASFDEAIPADAELYYRTK